MPALGSRVLILWDDWNGRRASSGSAREHLDATLDWILAAYVATRKQGVSAAFSLLSGWSPAYLETTGYLIPTLYSVAELENRPEFSEVATDLAEWLVDNQLASGGIPGGVGYGGRPIAFDTGQALFGLMDAYRKTHRSEFLSAACKAGDFLLNSLDEGGCYKRNLWLDTIHTYDVRISWALLLLAAETGEVKYRQSAERNLEWTLQQQMNSGMFQHNAFVPNTAVYTHLLAYTLRGLTECALIMGRDYVLEAVRHGLAKPLEDLKNRSVLPGAYAEDWRGDWRWTCPPGNCQMAIVFHRAAVIDQCQSAYNEAFQHLLETVKATQSLHSAHPGIRGGIKGSDPIWGPYQRFRFPNWGAKFFSDALLIEIHGKGGTFG
jgi:hypothetical protein